jgi:hypothetical protein
MNRHYDTAFYRDLVKRIRNMFENAAITTDIMVGFAGETNVEFEESVEFLKEISFAKSHVFAYSRRKGTVAHGLPNQIEKKEKAISLLNDLFAYKNIDVIIGNLAFCYWCEISEKKKIKYMSFLSNDIENNISENFIGSYKLDSKKLYDSFWKNLTNNIEFSNNEIWFGLENNIIYPLINYNSKIDNSVIQNIDETVKLLKSGNKFIFQGPIYSNQGSEIVPKDAVIDDERLETQQNWLNSNIIEFNQSKSNKFQIWNEIDLDLKIYNEEHSDRLLRRLKDILDKST